ncbi:glycosyltransferase [Nocardia sp. NPDC004068]|uniref:glycosyltransferase n=1 Tax=Nocardia sp. NPDC004068 TaxID=3364303 RepID=UPI0036AB3147
MRIVQLANFYTPASGGLRTCVDEIGRGYVAAGHDRVLVVPGLADADERTAAGRRITLRGPRFGSAGYHVLTARRTRMLLEELRPDVLECSDKLSVRWLAPWARRAGVPLVLFSHERIDAILRSRVPPGFPLATAADLANRRLSARAHRIIVTSGFARDEFTRIGARNVHRIPLGVDLETFRPLDPQLATGTDTTRPPYAMRERWRDAGPDTRRDKRRDTDTDRPPYGPRDTRREAGSDPDRSPNAARRKRGEGGTDPDHSPYDTRDTGTDLDRPLYGRVKRKDAGTNGRPSRFALGRGASDSRDAERAHPLRVSHGLGTGDAASGGAVLRLVDTQHDFALSRIETRGVVGLVLVSRLSREKRPGRAIEALRLLREAGIDAELTVIGDGPLRDRLREQASGLPVTFMGHVSERGTVARMVAAADIAVCPSPAETFGLAVLEALACGTPVVVPRAGAARELLGAPGSGVECDGTATGLAAGVTTLLAIPEYARRTAARRTAERFPWSATVAELLSLYAIFEPAARSA